jgi:hypothetical protein
MCFNVTPKAFWSQSKRFWPFSFPNPHLLFFFSLFSSYPAGFVHVYSVLYSLTQQGQDVKLAQYLFGAVYLITMGFVLAIYKRCESVSSFVTGLMWLKNDTKDPLMPFCWIWTTIAPNLCYFQLDVIQTNAFNLCLEIVQRWDCHDGSIRQYLVFGH